MSPIFFHMVVLFDEIMDIKWTTLPITTTYSNTIALHYSPLSFILMFGGKCDAKFMISLSSLIPGHCYFIESQGHFDYLCKSAWSWTCSWSIQLLILLRESLICTSIIIFLYFVLILFPV